MGLPLDHAGLALLLLGATFIVAEAFMPSFGALGVAGIAALIIGGAMLIDAGVPLLSWPLLLALAAAGAVFVVVCVWCSVKSLSKRPATGREALVGARAEVLDWDGGAGHVWAEGERWTASGPARLTVGAQVRIEGLDGLRMRVAPLEPGEKP